MVGIESSAKRKLGMRVLIADDQKNVGIMMALLVHGCRHHVVDVVTSGLEAIQAYHRHHPDVVLMDYCMAKLNGATACRYILAEDPAARIIFVSSWPLSFDLTDVGAIAVLQKPVSLEQLGELLNSMEPQLVFDYGPAWP
jgi:two-component system, chemotaxis family, chemotaxis protein CheY